jgi:hypothetical protein
VDPIFNRTFGLDSGPRVRLRLARAGDREAFTRLLNDRGVEPDDLDVRRLLAYDPVRRRVLAAFAPIDGVETLVGIGAIDLADDADVDTLVVDERLTAGLGELLVRILRGRAAARGHRVA